MQRTCAAVILLITSGGAGCSGTADAEAASRASSTATALVRVVNLVSDAPALDVCLREHSVDPSAPFGVGPLLASSGLTAGLAYPQASAHVAVPPGTYDLRVVAAHATDCATPLAGIPDRANAGTFEPGHYASLVAVGSLAKSFWAVDVLSDEPAPTPGRAKLRFVHDTMAAPALDVGMGGGGAFVPLFTGVSFRSAGTGDANGFVDVAPSSSTLVLRVAGRTFDTLSVPGFALREGTVTTVFSIGVAGAGGNLLGSMLRCDDADTSHAPLANCSVVP